MCFEVSFSTPSNVFWGIQFILYNSGLQGQANISHLRESPLKWRSLQVWHSSADFTFSLSLICHLQNSCQNKNEWFVGSMSLIERSFLIYDCIYWINLELKCPEMWKHYCSKTLLHHTFFNTLKIVVTPQIILLLKQHKYTIWKRAKSTFS